MRVRQNHQSQSVHVESWRIECWILISGGFDSQYIFLIGVTTGDEMICAEVSGATNCSSSGAETVTAVRVRVGRERYVTAISLEVDRVAEEGECGVLGTRESRRFARAKLLVEFSFRNHSWSGLSVFSALTRVTDLNYLADGTVIDRCFFSAFPFFGILFRLSS